MAIDADRIREWLMAYQFWWLEFLFALFVVSTGRALPGLVRSLGVSPRWWLAVGCIASLGLVIAYRVPPTTNRIYYDEQIYQNAGQNMADERRTQMCNYGLMDGGRLDCSAGEYNKEPYGYPYLLSLGFRIAGVSDTFAHHLNRCLHALMAVVLAVTAVRWFGNPRSGVFAALLISLIPEQLRWTATAAAEPSAALFALVAVLAAVEFGRTRNDRALMWLVACGAWAIQFRPESVLVAPVAATILLAEDRAVLKDPRITRALTAVLIAAGVYTLHVIAVQHDSWGAPGAAFSVANLAPHLAVNGWYYVADPRFPWWVTVLAIAGLATGRTALTRRLAAGMYFLLFWGIFLFFYAGSYNYGADVRYSLVSYAPLVLLAGLGISTLIETWLPSRVQLASWVAALGMVCAASPYLAYSRSIGEEAWAARADVAFARNVAPTLPRGALVLTQDPGMFQLWGVSAAQMSYALGPDFLDRAEARHGQNVFVHWGFWCNVADDVQRQLCRDAVSGRHLEPAAEHMERDYRFAFYRISRSGPARP